MGKSELPRRAYEFFNFPVSMFPFLVRLPALSMDLPEERKRGTENFSHIALNKLGISTVKLMGF